MQLVIDTKQIARSYSRSLNEKVFTETNQRFFPRQILFHFVGLIAQFYVS